MLSCICDITLPWLHSQPLCSHRTQWTQGQPSWPGCCPHSTHAGTPPLSSSCLPAPYCLPTPGTDHHYHLTESGEVLKHHHFFKLFSTHISGSWWNQSDFTDICVWVWRSWCELTWGHGYLSFTLQDHLSIKGHCWDHPLLKHNDVWWLQTKAVVLLEELLSGSQSELTGHYVPEELQQAKGSKC